MNMMELFDGYIKTSQKMRVDIEGGYYAYGLIPVSRGEDYIEFGGSVQCWIVPVDKIIRVIPEENKNGAA